MASRRIQEALQLFSELEHAPINDVSDQDRIRATSNSAPPMNRPPAPPGGGPQQGSTTRSTKSISHSQSSAGADDVSHKLSVADAIMKRLHRKNQELMAQLDAAKAAAGSGSSSGGSGGSDTAHHQRLLRDIAKRDEEIQQLRQELSRGASSTTNTSSSAARPPAPTSSSSSRTLPTAFSSYEADRKQWLAQYAQLLDAKLEYVAQGESTGKINAEVKKFFQALKQKIFDDAVSYEAHRAALNEELFEMEMKLASQYGNE